MKENSESAIGVCNQSWRADVLSRVIRHMFSYEGTISERPKWVGDAVMEISGGPETEGSVSSRLLGQQQAGCVYKIAIRLWWLSRNEWAKTLERSKPCEPARGFWLSAWKIVIQGEFWAETWHELVYYYEGSLWLLSFDNRLQGHRGEIRGSTKGYVDQDLMVDWTWILV